MDAQTASTLSGWNVDAEAFLGLVLRSVATPIWVIDHDGLLAFANPAAVAALGYGDLSELYGRPAHATVHYKHRNGTPFPLAECPLTRSRESGATVTVDEDWWVRRDGSMLPITYTTAPIALPGGYGAVVAFTDLSERLRTERALRERDVAEARAAELRAARRRVIDAADAERRRLSRDLHDGAQQTFVSVVLRLQMAEQKWEAAPARALDLVRVASAQAREGIEGLRELAAGIHPVLLTTRGLRAAVGGLADRLPIPVDLQITARRLPAPIEAGVYFVVAEALTNVIKHAGASCAWVCIEERNGRLVVEIHDDGVGGVSLAEAGTGLTGMADRVAALDGRLDVRSGSGTTVHAELPLPLAGLVPDGRA
jgi:PAS domain S-box-containing protein